MGVGDLEGEVGVSMATEKQFRIICYLKTLRFGVIAENADDGFFVVFFFCLVLFFLD